MYKYRSPHRIMYAKSELKFLRETITNLMFIQLTNVKDFYYALPPVQYSEVTHQLRKFIVYVWEYIFIATLRTSKKEWPLPSPIE